MKVTLPDRIAFMKGFAHLFSDIKNPELLNGLAEHLVEEGFVKEASDGSVVISGDASTLMAMEAASRETGADDA